MGKLPLYRDKCHILRQCHKIIVTHNNNMDNNKIVCPHCGNYNFKCSRGLTQHGTNAAYCSQVRKGKKKTRKNGYVTAPEMITFGDNYWQMHHNKLAKRAKQMDDQRLARREQIKELAKYVSKEFSASGNKLGVDGPVSSPAVHCFFRCFIIVDFPCNHIFDFLRQVSGSGSKQRDRCCCST
jgi:hypothetical protein